MSMGKRYLRSVRVYSGLWSSAISHVQVHLANQFFRRLKLLQMLGKLKPSGGGGLQRCQSDDCRVLFKWSYDIAQNDT